MQKQHNRKIYAGYYKRYDDKYIYVVAVVPDADTGEKIVIFHEGWEPRRDRYYTMTKQSFCEMVEKNGDWVDKFVRQPRLITTSTHIENLMEDGFPGPIRREKKDYDEEVYKQRELHNQTTYIDYAKDICKNFKTDLRRYKLCVAQKRCIGIFDKQDFKFLTEDIKFMDDCLNTILKSYNSYFKERYIKGKSIRKYAEEHGINRGSVAHIERKFIKELASALKARDDEDGICRLRKN